MWWKLSLVTALLAAGFYFYLTPNLEIDGQIQYQFQNHLIERVKDTFSYAAEVFKWNVVFPDVLLFWKSSESHTKLFTKEQLSLHKYQYLAIVGEVFDVTSKLKHYGKEGHYSFFTGLDGTRAYATGDFTEKGLIEDINGLSPEEAMAIEDFRKMYHKEYEYIGKLIGYFYDSNGQETVQKQEYNNLLKRAAENKLEEDKLLKIFPPCNSEYDGKTTRVWCTVRSGGINRDWVGVPRKYFHPGMANYKCVCVRKEGPPSFSVKDGGKLNRGDLDNPNLQEYIDCNPAAPSCIVIQ